MKKMIIAAIAFIIFEISFSTNVVVGQMVNGNDLKEQYNYFINYSKESSIEDDMLSFHFMGYVNGVVDLADRGKFFCFPKGLSPDQLYNIIGRYLYRHPEELHLGGHILIIQALSEVFPCK